MKKYRNPNIPKPTPSPDDKKKKGDGRVYAGGSQWFDERTGTYRPGTPKDILDRVYGRGKNGDGRKTIMPVKPKKKK